MTPRLAPLFASTLLAAALAAVDAVAHPLPYGAPPPPVEAWGAPVPTDDAGPERHNPAMAISGFIVAGVGTGALASGLVVFWVGSQIQPMYDEQCITAPCTTYREPDTLNGLEVMGIGIAASGAALLAVGIPLAVVGLEPDDDAHASAVPRVDVGLGSARASWRF